MPESAPARPPCELYVYYRIDPVDASAGRTAVHTAQAALCAVLPGLQTRLLRRADPGTDPGSHAGPQTWMEIYRHPDGLGSAALQHILAVMTELPPRRLGPRHTESFEPLPADIESNDSFC